MEKASVLLVMDMQVSILSNFSDTTHLLENVSKGIDKARYSGISVIFVRVGFRKGIPRLIQLIKVSPALKSRIENVDPEEWLAIHPSVAPLKDEIVVTKRRISAFTGSDLEVILRFLNINHLILMGVATSGVVLSTIREAADKDYIITVLSDACDDFDQEVHQVLMGKVFPRQAEVLKVEGRLEN